MVVSGLGATSRHQPEKYFFFLHQQMKNSLDKMIEDNAVFMDCIDITNYARATFQLLIEKTRLGSFVSNKQ